MSTQYYILRWQGQSLQKDEFLSASGNQVRIGQKEDCDVRLPNKGPYADELFAVIKPSQTGRDWQIVPMSGNVQTLVNGVPVNLTHYLSSGDRIRFSETDAELSFEVREDDKHGTGTVLYSALSRRMIRLLSGVAAAVVLLLSLGILHTPFMGWREREALRNAAESVFIVEADSVYYVQSCAGAEKIIRRSPIASQSGLVVRGTAFLTTDGRLITARHCVEPWLNYKELYGSPTRLPEPVSWAMEAETWNQMHASDTSFYLVSSIRIYTHSKKYLKTVRSKDFIFNRSRDEIVEFGDYIKEEYWRSITGRFNRSDMMLGDITVLPDFGRKGSIRLVPEKKMASWLRPGTALHFMGFPSRIVDRMESRGGKVISEYEPGHMISHDGNLDHGFSGGPSLMVHRGKAYAVGVVSTYDKDSRNCIYSVPITELPKEEMP